MNDDSPWRHPPFDPHVISTKDHFVISIDRQLAERLVRFDISSQAFNPEELSDDRNLATVQRWLSIKRRLRRELRPIIRPIGIPGVAARNYPTEDS